MSLNNIKKIQSERGFTIVELLIVIVVIGILAAIVIVAYTGVTRQANNNKFKSNATSIQKVAEAINASESVGSYPSNGADQAALEASFAQSPTSKLPEGVSITRVTTTQSDNAALLTDARNNTFRVWACGTGVNVYYPVDGGSVQVVKAGAGCS